MKSYILFSGLAVLVLYWASDWITFEVLEPKPSSIKNIHIVETDDDEISAFVVFPVGNTPPHEMHYVEHLVWLNSIKSSSGNVDSHSNAWTNSHSVGYWLSGPSGDLFDLLNKLSGVFSPIELQRDFAEQEKNIILREREFWKVGDIREIANEEMNAFLYQNNSIATSVTGDSAQIADLDFDRARKLHLATHKPDTATIIVIGGVSEKQTHRVLQKQDWIKPKDIRQTQPLRFNLSGIAEKAFQYPNQNTAPTLIWRHVVTLPESIQYDLLDAQTLLIGDILGSSLTGGLAAPLHYDAAIARSFDFEIWPLDEDNVEIRFIGSPDQGVSLSQLQGAFEDTFSKITTDGIPEQTFNQVFNRFEADWPDWNDDTETSHWRADYVLRSTSVLRMPLPTSAVRALKAQLSLDSTNGLLRSLGAEGRTSVALIGPKERF
ncbi:insulinase family protein [Ruegeria atlantica]|uniref:insulinase family protein n=1 Tax=Ruegeria atlantica TaxID=81569 RepID=UPI00147CFDFB|nr:insulinase family protein [Ruegeria atlantica]